MVRIAVLASGTGSNADNLCRYFENHPRYKIVLIASDNPSAGVFNVASTHHVKSVYLDKVLRTADEFIRLMMDERIDAILLAGYLRLIPSAIIKAFPEKILNIHPALLPEFGGKGMYGMNVHKAVIKARALKTGITIHIVNEHYDDGPALFNASVNVDPNDTPESVAAKVHSLEMKNYPRVAEEYFDKVFAL